MFISYLQTPKLNCNKFNSKNAMIMNHKISLFHLLHSRNFPPPRRRRHSWFQRLSRHLSRTPVWKRSQKTPLAFEKTSHAQQRPFSPAILWIRNTRSLSVQSHCRYIHTPATGHLLTGHYAGAEKCSCLAVSLRFWDISVLRVLQFFFVFSLATSRRDSFRASSVQRSA